MRAPNASEAPPAPAALLADLADWLAARGVVATRLAPLPGDVSPRRYVRVAHPGGTTSIAAYYPPEIAAQLARFAGAAALLAAAGVRVPRRLDQDAARGWMLVEDLGEATLYERRSVGWPRLERHLEAAARAAARIAALDPAAVAALGSPPLDAALLRRELEQTEKLLLAPQGVYDDAAAARRFAAALDALCERLGEAPLVPCHRDFMARNLVPVGDEEVAVLDFQDLRLGPPAYDLASLLNDSLFAPPALEARLTAGLAPLSYRRAVAQRTLKAAGTFAAFAARGAPRHLPLVAPTLERAAGALAALPETAAAWSAIAPRCAPLLAGALC